MMILPIYSQSKIDDNDLKKRQLYNSLIIINYYKSCKSRNDLFKNNNKIIPFNES